MDGAFISTRAQENALFMQVKLAFFPVWVWRYHYLSSDDFVFLLLLYQ